MVRSVLLLVLLMAVPAEPCDCAHNKRSVVEEFKAANSVFVGTLHTRVMYDGSVLPDKIGVEQLVFEVEAGFKNVTSAAVLMFNRSHSTCALIFESGATYLIYAFKTTKGELHTHTCSRTVQIDAAMDDLEVLGEPEYLKEELR